MSVPLKRKLRPLVGRTIERAKGLALYGDVDWAASRAYGLVQAMVRLNLQGREPTGTVRPEDRQTVLDDVARLAASRRFPDGRPLFSEVAPGSELYAGDAPGAPDLVVQPAQGTEVRGRNTSGRTGFLLPLAELGVFYPSGVHAPVGIVVAAGAGVRAAGLVPQMDIHQVTPSVLAAMGVPAPPLDATPMPFVTASMTALEGQPHSRPGGGIALTDEEEAEVLERLRGLGYVD
jgi:predicted AlkP superfamily phosphohydrolase/phosphomutase